MVEVGENPKWRAEGGSPYRERVAKKRQRETSKVKVGFERDRETVSDLNRVSLSLEVSSWREREGGAALSGW